jgi:hypothetical protein
MRLLETNLFSAMVQRSTDYLLNLQSTFYIYDYQRYHITTYEIGLMGTLRIFKRNKGLYCYPMNDS